MKTKNEETTEQKIERLKDMLCGFWAVDLQRAWRCGFDAGRKSVDIVPIEKKAVKSKRRQPPLVIGWGTKLCNKCLHIQADCRCKK